jgi:hypothetical protein
MISEWLFRMAPVAGVIVNTLVLTMVAHIRPGRIARAMTLGVICGLMVTVVFLLPSSVPASRTWGDLVDVWCLGVVTYVSLSVGLWSFCNLNITSMRIRIIQEIRQCGGVVALSDLQQRYSALERLSRRLDRLRGGQQLAFQDGRWRLNSRTLLFLALLVAGLRKLVMPRVRSKIC